MYRILLVYSTEEVVQPMSESTPEAKHVLASFQGHVCGSRERWPGILLFLMPGNHDSNNRIGPNVILLTSKCRTLKVTVLLARMSALEPTCHKRLYT